MTLMDEALEHRHLRAPRENGGTLIDPPPEDVGELLAHNIATRETARDYDVQGRSLVQLAAEARQELVQAAWRYTSSYRDVPPPDRTATERILLAGHQPQLFHPGVWFKNFALARLAREHRATAVNLVIDSDTIKTASLRVPSGSPDVPLVESLPLDRQTAEIPYEERAIVDRATLEAFGSRSAAAIAKLVSNPLVKEFWPLVVERARACGNLGECLAQARHQQEGRWGATTLEIPQSRVCSLPAFHWFACHLLARLPRFWEEYNRAVAEFRHANHVRSTAHPVPDLAIDDGWLEAPLWIWDRANPRRRRLFVRQRGDEIVLSDRGQIEFPLSLSPEGEATTAASQLAEFAARGIRIRTRALVTTMFARLFLGDVFLHGIGGAKYDQVTDTFIERFFGIKPPGYMTATATMRLPVEREEVGPEALRRVDWQLRELAYHPERHLDGARDRAVEEITQRKWQWIEHPPVGATPKQRCHEIVACNQRLQPFVSSKGQQLLSERERIANMLRAHAILASREYAFCLYPPEPLRRLMGIAS